MSALATRPMKAITSREPRQASSAPLPSRTMSWRHRGAGFCGGNGLSSRPQMSSSSASCSGRACFNSTPRLRSSHRNIAPGVSRLSSLERSMAPVWLLFGPRSSALCASLSVRTPSDPSSVAVRPSSAKATIRDEGGGTSGFARAASRFPRRRMGQWSALVRSGGAARRGARKVSHPARSGARDRQMARGYRR